MEIIKIIDIPMKEIDRLGDNLNNDNIIFEFISQYDEHGNKILDRFTIIMYDHGTAVYVKMKYL